MSENPYFRHEAHPADENPEQTMAFQRGGILLRADTLLAHATKEDVEKSGSSTFAGHKVVHLSRELPAGFARLKLLPAVTDRQFGDVVEYVQQPNNVLYGVRQMYLFVPEMGEESLRDPDFQTPTITVIVCLGEYGEKEVYAVTEDKVLTLAGTKDVAPLLEDPVALKAATDTSAETLPKLQPLFHSSRLVDQADREPLLDT